MTQISASHFDDATAFVSVSRLRINDLHPYVYRTRDGGATWQSIVTGLPENSPVNTVREDPVRKGMLFAGTETAVWMSLDDGDHWQSLQLNLPHTSMRDLAIEGDDLIVATHGRSFWILDDISSLRQAGDVQANADAWLFKPGQAYRVRRSTYTDTPLPADEPAGENPPDGAAIDYVLGPGVKGPVTLEILDAEGKLVRKYESTDATYATDEQLQKQLIPLYWIDMPKSLPGNAGKHRWVWDLHYTTPTATRYEYPISAVPHRTPRLPQGPLALPGNYKVRLTANGNSMTVPLTVKMDPRVTVKAADLAFLFTEESKLAGKVSESGKAALEAHSIREQIEKKSAVATGDLKASLEQLDMDLAGLLAGSQSPGGGEKEPGLDGVAGEVAALYSQVGQADAAPTVAQLEASKHAREEAGEVLRRWTKLKDSTIREMNGKLRDAHVAEFDLNEQPTTMPEGGDED